MMYSVYYDNVVPVEYCQMIIDKFESAGSSQQENVVLENHRSFVEINLNKHEEWKIIQNDLVQIFNACIQRYRKDYNIHERMWPEQYGYEQFRIKRYMPNGIDGINLHVDVENHASARRFLVFFLYLNDVEEGGETAFQSDKDGVPEVSVKPKAGRVLIFPSLWTHPHVAVTPISGMKYIVGGYLHYL
jgi:hypothetical protein